MTDAALEQVARPWYREPWPWIIIGLLGSVVVASLITFWIAVVNPDGLVVDEATYQEIRRGLRAQDNPDGAAEAAEKAPSPGDPADRGDGSG